MEEGGDCTQASPRRMIHSSSSEKRANKKIPVSSVFNDSEGLYGTTVCRCLVRRPNYSARLMRFGSSNPSEFATVRRRRTGTMYNVYRSVREKQGNFVYRQRVLKTVTSLRVFSLVFRGHDLLKIANINLQQGATLSLWKKISSLRKRRKWSLGLGQHLKGALPNVRTESH